MFWLHRKKNFCRSAFTSWSLEERSLLVQSLKTKCWETLGVQCSRKKFPGEKSRKWPQENCYFYEFSGRHLYLDQTQFGFLSLWGEQRKTLLLLSLSKSLMKSAEFWSKKQRKAVRHCGCNAPIVKAPTPSGSPFPMVKTPLESPSPLVEVLLKVRHPDIQHRPYTRFMFFTFNDSAALWHCLVLRPERGSHKKMLTGDPPWTI